MFVHRVFPMNQSTFAEGLLGLAAETALRCRGILGSDEENTYFRGIELTNINFSLKL